MTETTRLYLVGREKALIVNGSLGDVQGKLTAARGTLVRLEDDYEGVIVNPACVSHLEPGPDPDRDIPLIDIR